MTNRQMTIGQTLNGQKENGKIGNGKMKNWTNGQGQMHKRQMRTTTKRVIKIESLK